MFAVTRLSRKTGLISFFTPPSPASVAAVFRLTLSSLSSRHVATSRFHSFSRAVFLFRRRFARSVPSRRLSVVTSYESFVCCFDVVFGTLSHSSPPNRYVMRVCVIGNSRFLLPLYCSPHARSCSRICVVSCAVGMTEMAAASTDAKSTAAAAAPAAGDSGSAKYLEAHNAWRTARINRCKADNGWLTLCGLWFLNDGENRIGSDAATNTIVLPDSCPKSVGSVQYTKATGKMAFTPTAGVAVSVAGVDAADAKATAAAFANLCHDKVAAGAGTPTCLQVGGATGDVTLFVIERSGQIAIRGKDKNAKTRLEFKGIDTFPVNESRYCVDASYTPFPEGAKKVPHPNKLGLIEMESCPGTLNFSIDGKPYSLEVIDEAGSESEWFVIFKDQTSGAETYGMRYLYTDRSKKPNETVKIDFNRAYNPPCAFTPYATCALATKQNRLPIRIEAGEKLYHL